METEKRIEDIALVFKSTIYEMKERELISAPVLEEILSRPKEVGLFLRRYLAKRSGRHQALYFKKYQESFEIEALSGICPCISQKRKMKGYKGIDFELDLCSLIDGDSLPSVAQKIEAQVAQEDTSLIEGYLRLVSDYQQATLSKAQIRYFCLKYQELFKKQRYALVFLLRDLYIGNNNSLGPLGVIVRPEERGLDVSIVPRQEKIRVREAKHSYLFIYPHV